MKRLLLLTLLLCAAAARAQTTPPMFSGGWSTDNPLRTTAIAVGNTLTTRVYQITCASLVDADVLRFAVTVDGVPVIPVMQEGSVMVIEGKSVIIQQKNVGKFLKGSWKVMQQADVSADLTAWSISPQLNEEQLVAALKTEQEFVMSIDSSAGNCTGTVMTVFVDGVSLKDQANRDIAFLEGSTVVGKGKLITVRVAGTCRNPTIIGGQFRLAKR